MREVCELRMQQRCGEKMAIIPHRQDARVTQLPHALYPRSGTPRLDDELFRHPTAEYRGTPFWSWNTLLDRDQLLRQIDWLKEAGFGGFHIHARTGLATPYLGEEFMGHVKACAEKARSEGMLCWLYDEDRWPSGFAGGLVTQDPRFRAKFLRLTTQPYSGLVGPQRFAGLERSNHAENGILVARYHVLLEAAALAAYRRLTEGQAPPAAGRVWYAYLETATPSPWWNNQTYVDTLDKAAIERFVEITHERYAALLGADFGTLVPAIFTDEPQFVRKTSLPRAEDAIDVLLPWTSAFAESFQSTHAYDLLDRLPELVWDLPAGRPSLARYQYHDHVAECFAQAFADTIGTWCGEHGLALTGHMMEEPLLESQTATLSEAMRSYRSFHIPGIDMLCDWHEYTTAKQAQSAARQYGRPGVLSELYGVTNWDFDFAGHKAQGDWQAALGVTVRVPHLSWVSMAGEAKRDYPASIHYQSPWYREYPLIEDHFARLNTVLTRGVARVHVGVIHPIESYWLCFGPLDQSAVERDEREQAFADLTSWLLHGLIDFDFIAESLLPSLCPLEKADQALLPVGQMQYERVIVPGLRTIRSSSLDRLERFSAAGGTLIFAGEVPSLVDAMPSDRASALAERCTRIAATRGQLLQALAAVREVEVRRSDGRLADLLLHQVRDDGDRRAVFVCNPSRDENCTGARVSLRGAWAVTHFDTLAGTSRPLPATIHDGWTRFVWDFYAQGSLLVYLDPSQAADIPGLQPSPAGVNTSQYRLIADPVPISLSEPNVLLFDQAEFRFDDGAWQPAEEVLRVDNLLRTQLGYPLKMDAIAQPWSEADVPSAPHTLDLRFAVACDIDVERPLLALENAAEIAIAIDGATVSNNVSGWFVDEAITTVPLPTLRAGSHALTLRLPFGRRSNVEWCYLLGDFGVVQHGRHARIVAPPRELAFGDWTSQGLPFYAGNVVYHCSFEAADRALVLHVPDFKAPLLSVALDGKQAGKIAFAPYSLELGLLAAGSHTLDVTVYGNRVNAFGPVHNADRRWTWFGPNAWRTSGDQWAYEYQLKPSGILTAPQLLIEDSA